MVTEPNRGRLTMVDHEKAYPDAFERAARAVHENYFGQGSWSDTKPLERSAARQAARLAIEALVKNGLTLKAADPAGCARPSTTVAAKPVVSPTPTPAPRRF
jgi:hypothetical protein